MIYPSARHSRGHCIALFGDQTNSLKSGSCYVTSVTLKLVREDFDSAGPPPRPCDPTTDIIDGMRGYYSFDGSTKSGLISLAERGLLSPLGMPARGAVDFVRRRYHRYPIDAVNRGAITSGCPLIVENYTR